MKIQFPFFFLLLALAATSVACKHTHYNASNLPEKQLYWGSGGGFVGKESYFTLLEIGRAHV